MRRNITLAVAAAAWLVGFATATFMGQDSGQLVVPDAPAAFAVADGTVVGPLDEPPLATGQPGKAVPADNEAPWVAIGAEVPDQGEGASKLRSRIEVSVPGVAEPPGLGGASPTPQPKREVVVDKKEVPPYFYDAQLPDPEVLQPGGCPDGLEGEFFETPPGEFRICGDIDCCSLAAGKDSVLVLDGDQRIEGTIEAHTIILCGGTKRLSNGQLVVADDEDDDGLPACIVIEVGATLILEDDGSLKCYSAGSFRIQGGVVVNGGEFKFDSCTEGEDVHQYWMAGSTLTVNSGRVDIKYDHSFGAATIEIHGGLCSVDGDIRSTGCKLTVDGGVIRNCEEGGLFRLTGEVQLVGGILEVSQREDRGLRFAPTAAVRGSGGTVEIWGYSAASPASGILMRGNQYLPRVVCYVSTRIHRESESGAQLHVAELVIDEYMEFDAKGRNVIVADVPKDSKGEFVR